MGERIDVMGRWWLPGTPDHKVSGWFTFDEVEGGELRLGGALLKEQWVENVLPDGQVQGVRLDHTSDGVIYDRIHGQCNGVAFTLQDCFRQSVTRSLFGDAEVVERVVVNRLYRHVFIDGDESPEFDRCFVDLSHLTSFVDRTGLSVEWGLEAGPDAPFAIARADVEERLKTSVSDGRDIELVQMLRQQGDRLHEITLWQRWRFRISYDLVRPLDEAVDVVSDMQDLVSVAAGATANIESVQFEHPDVPLTAVTGSARRGRRSTTSHVGQTGQPTPSASESSKCTSRCRTWVESRVSVGGCVSPNSIGLHWGG